MHLIPFSELLYLEGELLFFDLLTKTILKVHFGGKVQDLQSLMTYVYMCVKYCFDWCQFAAPVSLQFLPCPFFFIAECADAF